MFSASLQVFPSLLNVSLHPIDTLKTCYNHFAEIIKNSYPYIQLVHLKNRFAPSAEVLHLRQILSSGNLEVESVVHAIIAKNFAQLRPEIYGILNKITDAELDFVLKKVFEKQGLENFQLTIKRLNGLLTLSKVELAAKNGLSELNFHVLAKEIAGPARRELESIKTENRLGFFRLVKFYITSTLDWLVDTFMYVFMLKDISDGDATSTERQMVAALQWQAFRENLTLISAWLIALTVYTGTAATAALIAASIAVPILTLGYIYFKYFKPAPAHVHPATNLTELAAKNELPTVLFRQKIVDKILTLLNINASTKSFCIYPLLVGPSGVGKTDAIKMLAQILNKIQVKGPFKDAQVLDVNANHLVDGQGDPHHLEIMIKLLAGYEKKVIIGMDEIQVAFATDAGQVLGNLLLTLMDTNGWPYMVFACTQEDFDKHVKSNAAFMRRVEVIQVNSLKEKETYAVLVQEMAENFSDIMISAKVLERLAKISKADPIFAHLPQPVTAKRILFKAIAQLRMNEFGQEKDELTKKIDKRIVADLEKKIESTSLQNPLHQTSRSAKLDAEIDSLKQKLAEKTENLKQFKELLDAQKSLNMKNESLAIKLADSKASNKETKEFILAQHYLKPALLKEIDNKKAALGSACPEITLAYIEEVIAQEKMEMLKRNPDLQTESSNRFTQFFKNRL